MTKYLTLSLLVLLTACAPQDRLQRIAEREHLHNCRIVSSEQAGTRYCGKACFQTIYKRAVVCDEKTFEWVD